MSLNILGFGSANGRRGYLKHAFKFLALAGAFLFISCGGDSDSSEKNLKQAAKEAYIYAVPVVEHNNFLSRYANNLTRINHIFGSGVITSNNTTTGAPNIDTLYTFGVLDIRNEPIIVDVPKIEDSRYVSIQLLDIFTNAQYLGSVSNRTDGKYLIALESWNGTVPADIKDVIKLPSSIILALGRIQVFNDNDAGARSLSLTTAFNIQTLSGSPTAPLEWNITYGNIRADNASTAEFFKTFNYILQYHLPSDTDKKVLEGFEKLHLGAGEEFSETDFSAEEWAQIEAGAAEAKEEIKPWINRQGSAADNYWTRSPEDTARWGEDYLTRAQVAWFGIYGNTKEEAVYFLADKDGKGETLNGSNNYTITFDAEPDAKYFWSLTLYESDDSLFGKPYGIRGIDNIAKNPDGSFTLYIQNEKPEADKENNWILAPKDDEFYFWFRVYGEETETALPPIVRQD
ncbi:MAG: DUF1214 domain-containing protein [Campylobacteraceae bacterium]|jgi:hypothetical protein|nr:DUF1214 domain-containing protein [Campylobacteraceae bacterium]